ARLYEELVTDENIYSSRRIMLPTPKFIIFYNGVEKQPERKVMKLSDSFEIKGEVNLELTAVQLNINPGYNEELKKGCPTLYQYVCYVEKVRKNNETMPIDEAVKKAVDDCIKENILRDFLLKNKAEMIQMSIFEYDEERHKKILRQEGFEDGLTQGMERGLEQGLTQGMERGLEQGLAQGIERGLEQGLAQGMERGLEQGLAQGMERGLEQGLAQGQEVNLISLICKKLKKDKSIEQIAEELEEEISVIELICKVASDFAPEYDVHEIYQALQMRK
ncbi:MAG: hypothetical protein IJN92_09050, partial [Lachnospiraceae bacterium]|nr:hypothetical protein [Lachnospiraceae bacterium]